MRPSTSELKHEKRNWLELPSDVTANILLRIGMIDIIENAQKVCTLWRKICKDPSMWRVINMRDLLKSSIFNFSVDVKLFKHVIDRSQGQLVDITFVYNNNDALLRYVADRSSVLRYLKFTCRHEYQTIKGLTESLMKFSLLEELSFYGARISKEIIETVGRHCPKLKSLKVNQRACKLCVGYANEKSLTSYNEIAAAIGGSLHELRHLELIGNKMSNIGLQVILDGCLYLETLDLRECFYIDLKGNSVTRCLKQISHLKLPTESLRSYSYVCARHDDTYDSYVTADPPEVQLLALRNFCRPCSRNLWQFDFGNLNSVDAFVLFWD
ncbi:putative F-box/LRR-repeat protein 23 [Tanacetum coccineum]